MPWTEKYWDIVNGFYWYPRYLGLESIPRGKWIVDGDTVTIPKAMTNPNGPLYRRTRSGDDYWLYVKRQEETFNHIFNLTLAMMPGDVVSEAFAPFISANDVHLYELQGGEIRDYDWIAGENVTSPDSFLLSEQSILAVELKFNAKTSLDQLAKYVALITGEELSRGPRDFVDLLYIFPSDPNTKFEKQTSLTPSSLGPEHFDTLRDSTKNQRVRNFLSKEHLAAKSTLSRIAVSCITWNAFAEHLSSYSRSLGNTAGDRTLGRLVTGLLAEIYAHPLSRVDRPVEESSA